MPGGPGHSLATRLHSVVSDSCLSIVSLSTSWPVTSDTIMESAVTNRLGRVMSKINKTVSKFKPKLGPIVNSLCCLNNCLSSQDVCDNDTNKTSRKSKRCKKTETKGNEALGIQHLLWWDSSGMECVRLTGDLSCWASDSQQFSKQTQLAQQECSIHANVILFVDVTWCKLAYWEERTRVGRQFPVSSPSVQV